jgi:hypothetical protein
MSLSFIESNKKREVNSKIFWSVNRIRKLSNYWTMNMQRSCDIEFSSNFILACWHLDVGLVPLISFEISYRRSWRGQNKISCYTSSLSLLFYSLERTRDIGNHSRLVIFKGPFLLTFQHKFYFCAKRFVHGVYSCLRRRKMWASQKVT